MEMIIEELSSPNNEMTEDSMECFLEALRYVSRRSFL